MANNTRRSDDTEARSAPLTPGQQGSDFAIAVLLALHRYGPSSHAELARATGIQVDSLRAALDGLKTRERIASSGHGMGAVWSIVL